MSARKFDGEVSVVLRRYPHPGRRLWVRATFDAHGTPCVTRVLALDTAQILRMDDFYAAERVAVYEAVKAAAEVKA